jgi:acetyl-CoA synthetase
MYDGVPMFPDAGRWWNIIEKHHVTKFYTAPTAIRSLRKSGPDEPKKYDLSSLKVLGTVGEPINPEAWLWYYNEVGSGRCPIVDTWWQTETGGHMISPLPGATPTKPGSATLPLPGIRTEILDAKGKPVKQGEQGFLCITKPWPAMFRSIWKDEKRYISGYFDVIKTENDKNYIYFTGDGAFYDVNGYITISGRTDDVMNVSGHRVSSAEIESAIASHPRVAEAAVVSRPDEITGEAIVAYIVPRDDYIKSDEVKILAELNIILKREIGSIIKISTLISVPGLPKTRSGKVLRRVLHSIACGEKPNQDLSTIEDPTILAVIQKRVESAR